MDLPGATTTAAVAPATATTYVNPSNQLLDLTNPSQDRGYGGGRRYDDRGGDRYSRDDRYGGERGGERGGDRRGGYGGYDRAPRGPPAERSGYDAAPSGGAPPPPREYDDRRRYD